MVALITASAFGDADDQLLNMMGGTALRDVTGTPANQPDAGEFANPSTEPVKLVAKIAGVTRTVECKEVEFGTTVVNNALGAVTLAVPSGVAEGDECNVGTEPVPTYFDTTTEGAVGTTGPNTVATVTIADTGAGTEIDATVLHLKFSQKLPLGIGFWTGNGDGKVGVVTIAAAAVGTGWVWAYSCTRLHCQCRSP